MVSRGVVDISRQRLDEYRRNTGLQSWQQYRSAVRSKDMPLRPGLSPSRPVYTAPTALRKQSPLQRYRSNPDLFYQTLGPRNRPSSPTSPNYSTTLSTNLLRPRNTNTSLSVRNQRLNDVLKVEDLRKAQEIVSEMTAEEVSRLPSKYIDELQKTISMLVRLI